MPNKSDKAYIPYQLDAIPKEELIRRCAAIFQRANARRSVRHFSSEPIAKEIIEGIIKIANTAPSGANKQPWYFCAISSAEIKEQIRERAEAEEQKNYAQRMDFKTLKELEKLGTNWEKPFLTEAPWLIVIFKRSHNTDEQGNKSANYYINESVGIACGLLISAIHELGLATVSYTPHPMHFLNKILGRPENEKAIMVLPVGYPPEDCKVPNISRKDIDQLSTFFE